MALAAEETERVFGKVHVLCNNAGVSQRNSIDVATYDDWDYVLNVNIGGTVNGLVSFLPKIKAHGEGGHVMSTSSMAGMIPVPGFAGIYATLEIRHSRHDGFAAWRWGRTGSASRCCARASPAPAP